MIQKWLYLRNCQSDLLQNLTQCSWVCALPHGSIIFYSDDVTGCIEVHETYPGWFSGLENTHNKEKIRPGMFLLCSEVIPGCPVSCMTVIQYFPSLLERNNVQKKLGFLER